MIRQVLVPLLCFLYFTSSCCGKQAYKIGGIFSNENQKQAFEEATRLVTGRRYRGSFWAEFRSLFPVHPVAVRAKKIPHLETHRSLNHNQATVNVYPQPKALYLDLVQALDWSSFIILYDNYENFLSVTSLLEANSFGSIRQLELDDDDEYRPMLANLKLTGQTRFVLVCTTTNLETILQQLQQVGMMTETYNYVVANLDLGTVQLKTLKYSGADITGVSVSKLNSNLETTLIHDAVQVFYEAIHQLTQAQNVSVTTKVVHCKLNDSWDRGLQVVNSMRSSSVQGMTGLVKFDSEGFRTGFNVDIVKIAPQGLVRVGNWNSTTGRFQFQLLERFEATNKFFPNRRLTVLITLATPYVMLRESKQELIGNDRYEGFCVDLIDQLAQILGFDYKFAVQEDGVYGYYAEATNEWKGMIGQIVKGTADLAVADLTITSEREKAVDFTTPFMHFGIGILYQKALATPPGPVIFASPFSYLVWAMIGVAYLAFSTTLFLIARLSPNEWRNPHPCVKEPEYLTNQFAFKNSLWFTMGALMQQGSELAPIALCTRAAAGAWWFFVLVMVSFYTANLTASLVVAPTILDDNFYSPFNNLEELVAQTTVNYGAKMGGATAGFFKDSNSVIWKYMQNHPENMVNDIEEGILKAQHENYALLAESTTIEYETARNCRLRQIGRPILDSKGYGIAVAQGSAMRNGLNAAILKLQETGVLTRLKRKWWEEKRGGGSCPDVPVEDDGWTPLVLYHLFELYAMLFIVSVLGLIGSFVELLLYAYRKSKTKNLDFKQVLVTELRRKQKVVEPRSQQN
ncbi:hypothetical protein NQ315_017212 [Exocentrus adspersus]|uniref:Glutamate receptor ionotropic, kainate 2 n=1 Tax=Exocentrus adspersus TaxID=1586481 RepID=A0AAV8V965_9CUCU|nr:hypothetical protein NQ315_017212 [Exocentrus adspersus]